MRDDGWEAAPCLQAAVFRSRLLAGRNLLRRAFADGRIEEWKEAYTADDEGIDTDLSWTLDIDGENDADLAFSSGNGKLPPRDMTMGVLEAIRAYEPRFATCFKELA